MSVPSRYAGLMAYFPQAPEMQKTPRYSEGSKCSVGPGFAVGCVPSSCQLPGTVFTSSSIAGLLSSSNLLSLNPRVLTHANRRVFAHTHVHANTVFKFMFNLTRHLRGRQGL